MVCIFGFNYSADQLSLESFDHYMVVDLRLSFCEMPTFFLSLFKGRI